jgi:hypothetical protein
LLVDHWDSFLEESSAAAERVAFWGRAWESGGGLKSVIARNAGCDGMKDGVGSKRDDQSWLETGEKIEIKTQINTWLKSQLKTRSGGQECPPYMMPLYLRIPSLPITVV